MRPRILFINRVYPPTSGATGILLRELAEDLVRDGWQVTVITSTDDAGHPTWETVDGVRIARIRVSTHWGDAVAGRMFVYLSFLLRAFERALRLGNVDVIVTKTDPPMLALLGAVLGVAKRCCTVHWAQDLYPDVAEALGVMTRSSRKLRAVASWALRRQDHVVVVGRCMARRLLRRGIAEENVSVIPNWAPRSIQAMPAGAGTLRRNAGLNGRFVVMYSGNMGRAHEFAPLLDAAEQLQDGLPGVVFLFVGDGPRRNDLEDEVARRRLDNVRFMPFQPAEKLADSLAAADVHVATMKKELSGLVVPSKVYGALAAGRPCLFIGPDDSEIAHLLRENRCGEVVRDGELADRIRFWYEHPETRVEYGRRAVRAAANGRSNAVRRFEEVFTRVLGRSTVPSTSEREEIVPIA